MTVDIEEKSNTAPSSVIVATRMAKRETWVDMPEGTAYAGFAFKLWVNSPQKLWDLIKSGDDDLGKEALAQVVTEHNDGLLDFEGHPFPPATAREFWDTIPTEMLGVMLVMANLEIAKLPKSLVPKTKRR